MVPWMMKRIRRVGQRLVLSALGGLIWLLLTAQTALDAFLLGAVFSFAILFITDAVHFPIRWRRLPEQIWAGLVYLVTISRDIFLSSVDVARRVLSRDMRLRPGIVAVPTQVDDELIAALSAHSITITPGELVVDFDGNKTMYVHCLDVNVTDANGGTAQTRRVKLFSRILGRPVPPAPQEAARE